MSVRGIESTRMMAAYGMKWTQKNLAGKDLVTNTKTEESVQSTGFSLHISNPKDGQAIGAMADRDGSVTVYRQKDFDPANPIYKVKIWDAEGNVTERMVDISKVDPKNCDTIEMFAYSSHYTDNGECPNAQRAFSGAKANYDSSYGGGSLFDKRNWRDMIKEIMDTQYQAGNLEGYLDFKKFWDFMDR